MKRAVVFFYNSFAYLVFICVVIYGVCFMGNIWITESIDAKPQMPLVPALLIDGSLLFLFVLYRTAKGNAIFRRYWNNSIPSAIEGTTNILLSSVLAALILWQWQPIGRVVWEIDNDTAKTIIHVLYFNGWILILLGFLLNYPKDFLGLKQSWLSFRNRPLRKAGFRSYYLHKLVRNPFYFGMLICLWSASTMTVSHLFFAMLMTLYVITIFQLEEKNLTINYRDPGRSRRAI